MRDEAKAKGERYGFGFYIFERFLYVLDNGRAAREEGTDGGWHGGASFCSYRRATEEEIEMWKVIT